MTTTPNNTLNTTNSNSRSNFQLLCCGGCSNKMFKRNYFRILYRRALRVLRKSETPSYSDSTPQPHHRHHHQSLESEHKNYLSPNIDRDSQSSSKCRCRSGKSRKGSMLSFSEVDTVEVHRMMKYINHSKVC